MSPRVIDSRRLADASPIARVHALIDDLPSHPCLPNSRWFNTSAVEVIVCQKVLQLHFNEVIADC